MVFGIWFLGVVIVFGLLRSSLSDLMVDFDWCLLWCLGFVVWVFPGFGVGVWFG